MDLPKKKTTTRSCDGCLWNWKEPINLPKGLCHNKESVKYYKRACGGCAAFETAVKDYVFTLANSEPMRLPKRSKIERSFMR